MRYKIFTFWVVVIGLMAARVALYDRISADALAEHTPASHAISSSMRD